MDNGLIVALSQFYNRPTNHGHILASTTLSLSRDNSRNSCGPNNVIALDHPHSADDPTTSTSNGHIPSISMELTDQESADSSASVLINIPIPSTSASIPSSFLVPSPPPGSSLEKKKTHRRGCRGGRTKQLSKQSETPKMIKIFNLSSHSLSAAYTSLLSPGLSFAPFNKPNPLLLFKDLNHYIRNLTLKRHFHIKQEKDNKNIITCSSLSSNPDPSESSTNSTDSDEEDLQRFYTQHPATSPPIIRSSLRPKSVFFQTHSKGPYIESFYRVVYADLVKMCNSTSMSKQNNLSPSETKALDLLIHADDIIIKTAYKGGGIVLLDKTAYLKEASRLLSDEATYMKLKAVVHPP